ncbi:wall-associated receptor kinase 5-like [Cornus florida]|uniref:wall-associated receptor kinase 5-like n=1 Tax=Cornus florida TaxID=4283 RepID=UPI00289C2C74|nr:wall-associated receptor kinase 5-like [Cornus florida]
MASLQIVQLQVHYLISNTIYSLVVVLTFLLLVKETRSAASISMVKSKQCQEKCRNVSVPYPFGIGKGCYRDERFEVRCNESSSHPATLPYLGDVELFHIGRKHVRVNAMVLVNCHNNKKCSARNCYNFGEALNYSKLGQPFRVSHHYNKLVAIGCDIFAYITDINNTAYIAGCTSLCYNTTLVINPSWTNNIGLSSCSGIGCCQTNGLPDEFLSYDLLIRNMNSSDQFLASKPCSIAFIAEKNFSDFNKFNTSSIPDEDFLSRVPVPLLLDWAIGDNISDCREASRRKDYSCGRNSYCTKRNDDVIGYECSCSQGYQGNPYLENGCQDIDECEDPSIEICPKGAICVNTVGSYSCKCKPGYRSIRGDGIECIPKKMLAGHVAIGIGSTIGVLVLIVIGLWLYRKLEKKQKQKMKRKFFRRNGGLLLQQQISSSNRSAMKTKLFIVEELEKATDNFNESRFLGKGGLGTVYKGMLTDGSIVAVKKSNIIDETQVGQFINEVIILSHINHRNIVKLLGCCLEIEVPMLVYEYVSNGTLSDHLHDEGYGSMSWNNRLRVAGEIAGALAYLHSYASTTIFHRDIKSSNILLDENYRAVVSDFGLSRSVPLNKTHLTTLVGGTFGYLDPEYFRSGQLTDKSDVYAFGVILAELLTGRKAVSSDRSDEGLVLNFRSSMKQNRLFETLETIVVNDGREDEIQVVATLAKKCIKLNARKRPNMKEVAAELDRLIRIQEQPLVKHNSVDSYCSLSENSYSYRADAVVEEG